MRKEISNIIKEWKNEANVKGVVLVGVYADFRDTIKKFVQIDQEL